jgi:hypothetical protein
VGESEEGKKDKTTPDVGGKSLSEKSQSTCTSKNPFEKSSSKQTTYFVLLFKDKRTGKNGPGVSSSSSGVTFLSSVSSTDFDVS